MATGYRLALLWLMDRLESARVSEAMAAWGSEFGPFIPAEHLEKNNNVLPSFRLPRERKI